MNKHNRIGILTFVILFGMLVVPTMAIYVDPLPPDPPPTVTITHADYEPFWKADYTTQGTNVYHNLVADKDTGELGGRINYPSAVGDAEIVFHLYSDTWYWFSQTYNGGYLWVSTDFDVSYSFITQIIYDPIYCKFIIGYGHASVKVQLIDHWYDTYGGSSEQVVKTLLFAETPTDRPAIITGSDSYGLYQRFYVGYTASNFISHRLEIRITLHTDALASASVSLDCDAFKFYVTNPY